MNTQSRDASVAALSKIRNIANEQGTVDAHGQSYVEGMRRAAHILEGSMIFPLPDAALSAPAQVGGVMELPQLPEPGADTERGDYFTEEQMHAYARSALESALGQQGDSCVGCMERIGVYCKTCLNDAQAAAVNDYHQKERAETHELVIGERFDSEALPNGWIGPLARFTGFYNEGDDFVGIWPAMGWELSQDQSGTILEWLFKQRFAVPQNVEINPIPYDTLHEYRERSERAFGMDQQESADSWLNDQLQITPPTTTRNADSEG